MFENVIATWIMFNGNVFSTEQNSMFFFVSHGSGEAAQDFDIKDRGSRTESQVRFGLQLNTVNTDSHASSLG